MRLLSWNVHGFIGGADGPDPAGIAEHIQRMAPDISAIQEIDLRIQSEGVLNRLREVAGEHMIIAPTLGSDDGWYGQGLFSRAPIDDYKIHDISHLQREPRRLIDAVIVAAEGRLRVMATHLGLRRAERREQLSLIHRLAETGPALPTILIGDLNEWLPAPKMHRRLLGTDSAASPWHRLTFPARRPVLSLDRIMTRPGHLLRRSWTDPSARGASDHLPLLADITLSDAIAGG